MSRARPAQDPPTRTRLHATLTMPAAEDCPICSEPMGFGTGLAKTRAYQCGHAFCAPCVRKWAWRNDTCPLCRAGRYYSPTVAWLRQYAFHFIDYYAKFSVLVCLLHAFLMLSGHTITISYAPDSRFQDVVLECSSFDACVQSHVSFLFHYNLK